MGAVLSAAMGAAPEVASAQESLGRPPAEARPMPDEAIGQSMSALIDDGYDIVTFSAGLGGFGYLLRRDRSYVLCAVNLYGDAPCAENRIRVASV